MDIQDKIDRIILARKDAEKEYIHCSNTGNRDESFWEGYLSGIDYALFILNDVKESV
ncbi:MAG: hypothetical protein O3A49_04580 [Candidatus Marinimicrobia bacterium]|nr:hypothetical protein [Candidatus Neomarinimicrobiota bacterium]